MSAFIAPAPRLVTGNSPANTDFANATTPRLPSEHLNVPLNALTLISTAVLLGVSAIWYIYSSKNLPRGPWGFPVLGECRALEIAKVLIAQRFFLGSFPMLTHYPELTLDKWARKYGSLYSVRLGNQLFAIVSDPAVAKELMITQGAIFSNRKEMFIKSQIVFAGRGITATPYNDRW